MTGSLRFRLSALMFLQYAVLGLWVVTLATFLKAGPDVGGLSLTGQQIGWLYATFALAAAVAPLIAGLLADTLFSTQRVLTVLHLVAAGLLLLTYRSCIDQQTEIDVAFRQLAFVERSGDDELWRHLWERDSLQEYLQSPETYRQQRSWKSLPLIQLLARLGLEPRHHVDLSFPQHWSTPEEAARRLGELTAFIVPAVERLRSNPKLVAVRDRAFTSLFWLLFVYNLCYLPSVTLANSLCFRNMPHPERQFGSARVFGTIGWIAALVLVGWGLPAVSPLPLLLAAAVSIVLAALCVVQPHTPPLARPKSIGDWLGLPAVKMLADRSFVVFLLSALMSSVLVAFHNIFTNPFLVDLHLAHSAAFQAIGQTTEIAGILLIPFLRGWLGTRWLLTLGLLASAGRFFGYASCSIPLVIGLGLTMHGLGFSLFYITAAIYVDMRAPGDLRASAQGLVTQITSGVGALLGTALSGSVVDAMTSQGVVDWRSVWLVPAVGTLGIAVIFVVLFKDAPRPTKMEPQQV